MVSILANRLGFNINTFLIQFLKIRPLELQSGQFFFASLLLLEMHLWGLLKVEIKSEKIRNVFILIVRIQNVIFVEICDVLCDLVPFVQFKKREKHPRRSVNFNKVAGF